MDIFHVKCDVYTDWLTSRRKGQKIIVKEVWCLGDSSGCIYPFSVSEAWNRVSALTVKWDAQKKNDSEAISLHYDKNKLTSSEGTNKVKLRVHKHVKLSWRKLWIMVWVLTISLSCCTMVGTLFPCHTRL